MVRARPQADSARLSGAVRRAERFLRVRSGLRRLVRDTPALCAAAGLGLAVNWLWGGHNEVTRGVLILLPLAGLADFWLGFSRGPSTMAAALALDTATAASGQLAAGYDRATRDAEHRSPYDDLLLARIDGSLGPILENARRNPPTALRKAEKIAGREFLLPALTLAAVLVLLTMKPRRHAAEVTPLPPQPTQSSLARSALTPDELEFLRGEAERLLEATRSEEGKDVAQQLLALVDTLADGEKREETLVELAALADQVRQDGAGDFGEQLRQRGEALASASASAQTGDALKREDLEDAAKALEALAERLQNEKKPLSPKELEELRRAITEAQRARQEAEEGANPTQANPSSSRAQELEDKRRSLLEKKQKNGKLSPREQGELERTQRQLERLDRKKKQQAETLSALDKALAEAAKELQELQQKAQSKSGEKAAQRFEEAARAASSEAERRMTDEEKKQLLEQMERLKERLRQAEKDGTLKKRLEEFQNRARGKSGEASGEADGVPRSVPLPVPGQGSPSQKSAGTPGEQADPADNPGASGKEPGSSHDPRLTGEASARLEAETARAHAAARDTGSGESESETILAAAEEGFVRQSYEKLYTDYHTVVEELMDRESIPRGHKHQVERYFELIRPREASKQ